jgi:hypothetical protein
MTYDEALKELTVGRGYGPTFARGLLHHASAYGRVTDELSSMSPTPAIQICATNDAGTRFSIRDVTVTRTA